MSSYAYEFEKRNERLETYEWDNVWWEQTEKTDVPRVLYIGDSISCGTRRVATRVAENAVLFDGLGTSKALDNPYFRQTVSLFADQQKARCAVLFNNGLHGWHLDDETEYGQYYESMLQFLKDKFEGTLIALCLTTHVANPERNARVVARNRVVTALAKKYNLPVVDLYSITEANPELLSADGVHFAPEGYQLLANELVSKVKELANI
ncbi:MAG: SGNH/GDSL hydrolase family protein [Clostridia bacterium]|nr:SGNH/GDSL hydrolase family protein [Clostridia bacterium]MBQ8720059.1 SGNH/GDSL hydrolase family protein [Clostridia bacterium]